MSEKLDITAQIEEAKRRANAAKAESSLGKRDAPDAAATAAGDAPPATKAAKASAQAAALSLFQEEGPPPEATGIESSNPAAAGMAPPPQAQPQPAVTLSSIGTGQPTMGAAAGLSTLGAYGAPSGAPPAAGVPDLPPAQVSVDASGEQVLKVEVPNGVAGGVIGRGGETIQRLQAETGARIQVEPTREQQLSGKRTRTITISGAAPQVAAAKAQIDGIAMQNQQSRPAMGGGGGPGGPPGGPQLIIPVEDAMCGVIIGRGGSTINRLQAETGVHIKVPSQADDPTAPTRVRSVVLTGEESAMQALKTKIEGMLEQERQLKSATGFGGGHSSRVGGAGLGFKGQPGGITHQHPIPDSKAGVVIGKGGSRIQELQSRLQVHINVPQQADPTLPSPTGEPMRALTIEGQQANCLAAAAEITQLISMGAMGGGGFGGPPQGGYGGAPMMGMGAPQMGMGAPQMGMGAPPMGAPPGGAYGGPSMGAYGNPTQPAQGGYNGGAPQNAQMGYAAPQAMAAPVEAQQPAPAAGGGGYDFKAYFEYYKQMPPGYEGMTPEQASAASQS